MKTLKELVGKTFYVTSQYAKNLPFKIVSDYCGDWVTVHTWEGRNAVSNRPMGRVKEPYSVSSISEMIEAGILSEKKLK